MQLKQRQGLFCQSCSMPMERPESFGTNAAGKEFDIVSLGTRRRLAFHHLRHGQCRLTFN